MSAPQEHFRETRQLASQLGARSVAAWLLEQGFYPEQYVLPPCFKVLDYDLQDEPYFPIIEDGSRLRIEAGVSQLATVRLPSSILTVRDFSIIDPRHYHDMVFHIAEEWALIVNQLFDEDIGIFSYSFPIPISRENPGELGTLRAGRMIYEFIEMAERDLVAEAHRYKFLLKTDIRAFYQSIYTHSIAWALHGKLETRQDRFNMDSLGKKLDKLMMRSHDECTNGIAVGPAISDLISELLLSAIDRKCSRKLDVEGIDYLGVRFKDDYRFLCNSEYDARSIISVLQECMRLYHLTLSEDKSETFALPEGLYRPWRTAYNPLSLRYAYPIPSRLFEARVQSVLAIDARFPGAGVIDTFLGELTSKKGNLKLALGKKSRVRAFSLLLLLRNRRPKALPMVLAIIEAMLEKYDDDEGFEGHVAGSLSRMLEERFRQPEENQYEIIWLIYFIKTVLNHTIQRNVTIDDPFISTLLDGERAFFSEFRNGDFFQMPNVPVERNHLLQHLAIFRSQETDARDEGD